MKYIVDRIEGEYIVLALDDLSTVNIPKVLCPNAREGDVLTIETDKALTESKKQSVKSKMNNIFKK